MTRTRLFLLLGLLGLGAPSAMAEDLTNRWGIGLWGGPAIPTGSKYVTDNADTGLNLGGWLRQGFSRRWSIALSYDNIDLEKSDIYMRPIIISMLYSPRAPYRLTPLLSLGLGPAVTKVLPTDSAGDTTLAFKAGAGLEWFVRRYFSVGAMLNYHYAVKNSGSSRAAHVLAPVLMANYYFAGPEEEAEEEAAEAPEEAVQAPPADSDGDGVVDEDDRCPDTPENARVDAAGCQFDSDGDRVPDESDECPDTPKGRIVNRKGCPVAEKVSIRMSVEFDSGKADVKPESRGQIARVAEFLQENPNAEGEIAGHTDNIGSDKSNLALSQMRAENVRRYLVEEFNIEASRLTAKGYGASVPIASNASPEGRQKNRRVVAILTAIR